MTGRTAFARGSRTILTAAPFLLGLFLLSGCDDRYPDDLAYGLRTDTIVDDVPTDADKQPAEFDLPGQYPNTLATLSDKGAKVINPADAKALPADKRRELEKALVKRFGTPASPKVEEVSESTSDLLRLSPSTLKQGSQLFRRHCLHCHGLTGNGQGPTAPWVHPHPRDFRRGIFKFTSTTQPQGDARKPRRQDLLRTLREGIEGTSMPTFGILPDKELEAIVSYVIHLSLRGEVELYTMRTLAQDPSAEVEETVVEALGTIGNKFWAEAQNLTIDPDPYKATGDPERVEAVKRGFELFNKAGCLSCHINYGRNDRYLYDIWGTIVRPANLTTGIFRGGRRPIDLYFRVHGGINGSKMPAVNDEVKQAKQIWDLVEFLQALPHKAMLPDKVRADIYGTEQ